MDLDYFTNGLSATIAGHASATRKVGSHAVGWFGAAASPCFSNVR
jgi:hypothetical protein